MTWAQAKQVRWESISTELIGIMLDRNRNNIHVFLFQYCLDIGGMLAEPRSRKQTGYIESYLPIRYLVYWIGTNLR